MNHISQDIRIHSLAHDIRGMLAPAQLVVDTLLGYDDQFVVAKSEKIQAAVNRITMYCSDALARPKDIFGETTLLSDIIRDVVNITMPLSKQHGISFKTSIEKHPISISSAITLHRIIMNLALNSLDALRVSGGTSLKIESHKSDGRFHIDITDDGPGLPETIINLFRPHAKGRDKRSQLPHSLGLVSTIWAARSMGGQLLLLQTGETGTTFRLTLP